MVCLEWSSSLITIIQDEIRPVNHIRSKQINFRKANKQVRKLLILSYKVSNVYYGKE